MMQYYVLCHRPPLLGTMVKVGVPTVVIVQAQIFFGIIAFRRTCYLTLGSYLHVFKTTPIVQKFKSTDK